MLPVVCKAIMMSVMVVIFIVLVQCKTKISYDIC